MGRGAKYGIVALLCGASLLVGVVSGWWLRGPPRGTKQLLDILADMEAKPATDADWKAVAVDKSTANVSGVELPVVSARNLRPVLEADANICARHIGIVNTRDQNVLKTLIWSIKANNALELDWKSGTVQRLARPNKNPEFGPQPQECPMNVKWTGKYVVATIGGTDYLRITTPKGTRKIEWQHPTDARGTYILDGYRYAAGIEESKSNGRAVGIIIYDLDALDVAARIPVPPQVGRYPPLFVVDANTDLVLCFDLDVAWIVCVDLRPARLAAEAAEKQAPPPEKKEP